MPEMLTPTSAIMGAGLGKVVALITGSSSDNQFVQCFLMSNDVVMSDGRFSGGSHGFIIGHVTPEAQVSFREYFVHVV